MLKLIGTGNRAIADMILQQALGVGLTGFIVGKVAATVWAPIFAMALQYHTASIVVTHDLNPRF